MGVELQLLTGVTVSADTSNPLDEDAYNGKVAAGQVVCDASEIAQTYSIPGVSGVRWSSDGITFEDEGSPLPVGDVTSVPKPIWCMFTRSAVNVFVFLPQTQIPFDSSDINLTAGIVPWFGVPIETAIDLFAELGVAQKTWTGAPLSGGADILADLSAAAVAVTGAPIEFPTPVGTFYLTSVAEGANGCCRIRTVNSDSAWSTAAANDSPTVRVRVGKVNNTSGTRTFTESSNKDLLVTSGTPYLYTTAGFTSLPTVGASERFCIRLSWYSNVGTGFDSNKDFVFDLGVSPPSGMTVSVYASDSSGTLALYSGSSTYPSHADMALVDANEPTWDWIDNFNRASLGSDWVLHEYVDSTNEMDFAIKDSTVLTTGSDYTAGKGNRMHVASSVMSSEADMAVAITAMGVVGNTTPRASVVTRHNGATDDAVTGSSGQMFYQAQMAYASSECRVFIGKAGNGGNLFTSVQAESGFTYGSYYITGWVFEAEDSIMLKSVGTAHTVYMKRKGGFWVPVISGVDDESTKITSGVTGVASYAATGVSSEMTMDDFKIAIL